MIMDNEKTVLINEALISQMENEFVVKEEGKGVEESVARRIFNEVLEKIKEAGLTLVKEEEE